jgi:hypothetical protein
LTGELIGIMDPSLTAGLREELSENDLLAFGLIGWDVTPPGLTAVPTAVLPAARANIASISPNPFNPRTTIAYQLEQDSNVRLAVYDLRGREVRTLVAASKQAGRHTITWDGTDTAGRPAASGIYLLRLNAAGAVDQAKVLLAK